MLTVSPELLAQYLATLPKGAFQIVLKDGPFELKMNLQPTPDEDAPQVEPGNVVYLDEKGQPIPAETAELFPQLVHKRVTD